MSHVWVWFLVLAVFLGLATYLILWFITPLLVARKNLKKPVHSKETTYVNPNNTNERIKFGSILDPPSCYLSLVIPAYNEENRIEEMIKDTLTYLNNRQAKDSSFTFELLVVDDGSVDHTVDKVMALSQKHPNSGIRVMKLVENMGKGGAIRKGMLRASGKYILMVDADGATNIEDLKKLEEAILEMENQDFAVAVGSRAHLEDDAIAKRNLIRNILMHGFHFIVSALCVKNVRDTQCGFKLFTRKAVQAIFPSLHVERWAFDVEVLYICQLERIPVKEVAVRWHEIPGSKLSVVTATLTMLRELVLIRLCYTIGIWSLKDGKYWLKALGKTQ